MSMLRGIRGLVAIVVLLASGCALMKTPPSLTTLQLQLPAGAQSRQWPPQIAPRPTRAVAALQGRQMLVVDEALLMQHAGLRWIDAPAILLDEQLRALRFATVDPGTPSLASIEVWLTQFNIRVGSGGEKSVEVAAMSELACLGDQSLHRIPLVAASVALADEDARSVAAAFAAAVDQVIAGLAQAASEHARKCGPG